MSSVSTQKLAGHDVAFPHDPYGVQKVFMCKLINALQNKQNALLEAPTGCGKTLCLLCAALAWQSQYKKNHIQEVLQSMGRKDTSSAADRPADTIMDPDGFIDQAEIIGNEDDLENDDQGGALPPRIKTPQIYYATRTHSQIDQVVQELKKTGYNPKMAILAARKHYCINNAVIKSGQIDEKCEELQKDEFGGCRFHKKQDGKGRQLNIQLHDIEDLLVAGKKQKMCPYYASRDLAVSAELVFTPYNYLIDPSIREALGINLTNAIVIFDEAHNIEDTAREAGSMDVELSQLLEVREALAFARVYSSKPEPYQVLQEGVEAVMSWLKDLSDSPALRAVEGDRDGKMQKEYTASPQILSCLSAAKLDPDNVKTLFKAYRTAREYENSKDASFATTGEAAQVAVPEDRKTPGAGGAALGYLCQLLNVVSLLHGIKGLAEGKAATDRSANYRMVVWKQRPATGQHQHGRRVRRAKQQDDDTTVISTEPRVFFGLWAMSPSVAFQNLAVGCHSVILTSGTLSPLVSFAGELGTEFAVQHEGRHVVNMEKQVWAGVLPKGPGGTDMSSTYRTKDNRGMHDEMGETIYQLAQVVPGGLLIFFPSYHSMDDMVKYWQSTGLLDRLRSWKQVILEPREGGGDFERAMEEHKHITASGRGSCLMAVCRGKASEGIDFRDAQARAVVIIGIPYPAARDTKVVLKKQYNNNKAAAMGSSNRQAIPGLAQVVNGEKWYELQAFRALNQAVGRCIRHKYDYGAVIFMDTRFTQANYTKSLPAWVRNSVKVHSNFQEGRTSLEAFFQNLKLSPPQPDYNTPPPPPPPAGVHGSDTAADIAEGQQGGMDNQCAALQPHQQPHKSPMHPDAVRGHDLHSNQAYSLHHQQQQQQLHLGVPAAAKGWNGYKTGVGSSSSNNNNHTHAVIKPEPHYVQGSMSYNVAAVKQEPQLEQENSVDAGPGQLKVKPEAAHSDCDNGHTAGHGTCDGGVHTAVTPPPPPQGQGNDRKFVFNVQARQVTGGNDQQETGNDRKGPVMNMKRDKATHSGHQSAAAAALVAHQQEGSWCSPTSSTRPGFFHTHGDSGNPSHRNSSYDPRSLNRGWGGQQQHQANSWAARSNSHTPQHTGWQQQQQQQQQQHQAGQGPPRFHGWSRNAQQPFGGQPRQGMPSQQQTQQQQQQQVQCMHSNGAGVVAPAPSAGRSPADTVFGSIPTGAATREGSVPSQQFPVGARQHLPHPSVWPTGQTQQHQQQQMLSAPGTTAGNAVHPVGVSSGIAERGQTSLPYHAHRTSYPGHEHVYTAHEHRSCQPCASPQPTVAQPGVIAPTASTSLPGAQQLPVAGPLQSPYSAAWGQGQAQHCSPQRQQHNMHGNAYRSHGAHVDDGTSLIQQQQYHHQAAAGGGGGGGFCVSPQQPQLQERHQQQQHQQQQPQRQPWCPASHLIGANHYSQQQQGPSHQSAGSYREPSSNTQQQQFVPSHGRFQPEASHIITQDRCAVPAGSFSSQRPESNPSHGMASAGSRFGQVGSQHVQAWHTTSSQTHSFSQQHHHHHYHQQELQQHQQQQQQQQHGYVNGVKAGQQQMCHTRPGAPPLSDVTNNMAAPSSRYPSSSTSCSTAQGQPHGWPHGKASHAASGCTAAATPWHGQPMSRGLLNDVNLNTTGTGACGSTTPANGNAHNMAPTSLGGTGVVGHSGSGGVKRPMISPEGAQNAMNGSESVDLPYQCCKTPRTA